MKAMKVLMAIAIDNRIKFWMVMQSVPEIGFRFEKLIPYACLLQSLTTACILFLFLLSLYLRLFAIKALTCSCCGRYCYCYCDCCGCWYFEFFHFLCVSSFIVHFSQWLEHHSPYDEVNADGRIFMNSTSINIVLTYDLACGNSVFHKITKYRTMLLWMPFSGQP